MSPSRRKSPKCRPGGSIRCGRARRRKKLRPQRHAKKAPRPVPNLPRPRKLGRQRKGLGGKGEALAPREDEEATNGAMLLTGLLKRVITVGRLQVVDASGTFHIFEGEPGRSV